MSHIANGDSKVWPCVLGGVALGTVMGLALAHTIRPSICKTSAAAPTPEKAPQQAPAKSASQKAVDDILHRLAANAVESLEADTKGDAGKIAQALSNAKELQGNTKAGAIRCDYEYIATRGDTGCASTFGFGPDAEIRKVEGWTFEAVQRGPDPATGEYPASEFRLVKADGSKDAYWNKNWDAIPNRSGYVQVKSKPQGNKHHVGYFNEEDYTQGTVYRYEPAVIKAKLQATIKELSALGVCGIAADVGYSQQFQESVRGMTNTPISLSSLQQLSLLSKMYDLEGDASKKIVVFTANGKTFDCSTMIPKDVPQDSVVVVGMETNGFGKWVAGGNSFSRLAADAFDSANVEEALEFIHQFAVETVAKVKAEGGQVVCFVNECAEMPAYTNGLRRRMKMPVYDTSTGIGFLQSGSGLAFHAAYIM